MYYGGFMLETNLKEIAELLKVLANENRLAIVCNLLEMEMTVSELHKKLSHISQPALSQHLAVLKSNKIIDAKRSGLNITYSIKDDKISKIIQSLRDIYCSN
jgi:DNA-binding transcriptional ArsR family regulator